MTPGNADTIYAPATAPGKAGVAVIRASGARAGQALCALAGFEKPPPPRKLVPAGLKNENGAILDQALVVFFPAPRSFTGEDVAEFHIHGGRAVTTALGAALSGLGLRMAEPGEFTRRAFLNGRVDLTSAEGLADLVAAETEAQRLQALRQMEGGLFRLYEEFRSRLLRALAHLEAALDFPDEDLPEDLQKNLESEIDGLVRAIDAHLNDARRGERLRDGHAVVILGAPNAGKSSLLNALVRREAAIVSSQAGTTRDVVEAHLDLSGLPVILADTAGLRDAAAATPDPVEAEGMRRALARAGSADLKLVLFDASSPPDAASLALLDEKAMAVMSKTDLMTDSSQKSASNTPFLEGGEIESKDVIPETAAGGYPESLSRAVKISSVTGEGIAGLLAAITARLQEGEGSGAMPPLTRARHREALTRASESLRRARENMPGNVPPEIAAEDLRAAASALGRLTGRVDVEELLDVIFHDFCIGK